jgi:hypothetical protein
MDARSNIAQDLLALEQELRDLEIRYEQYFAGVEKREPVKDREGLAGKLRRLTSRHITQTDLRFRIQTLASRFHTYCGHWDRNLRLIEEGRFHRHARPATGSPSRVAAKAAPVDETERIFGQLAEAYRNCNLPGRAPDRNKVAEFLSQQQEKIRERFGDRDVEFRVEIEGGRPKIKVRAK